MEEGVRTPVAPPGLGCCCAFESWGFRPRLLPAAAPQLNRMRRSGSVAYTECSVSFLGGSAGYLPYAGRGAWWVETLRTTDLVFDWEAPEARKEIARGVSPGYEDPPLIQAPEGRQDRTI